MSNTLVLLVFSRIAVYLPRELSYIFSPNVSYNKNDKALFVSNPKQKTHEVK